MKTLLLSLLISAVAFGADVTGNWSGNYQITKDGELRTEPAFLILKQEGTTLTGSGGPDREKQLPMKNGKAEGGKLTFEISMEEGALKFDLAAAGDALSGEVQWIKESGTEVVKLNLKREK